jgi:hypothetical protein
MIYRQNKFYKIFTFFFMKLPTFILLAVFLMTQSCAYRVGKTGYEIHSAIPLGLRLGDYLFDDSSCIYSNDSYRHY